MGYNSVLVVLNDRLDEIERDPDFGKKVAQAIREMSYLENHTTYITGQTKVISMQHADTMVVIAAGNDTGQILGYGHYSQSKDELIQNLEQDRKKRALRAKIDATVAKVLE